MEKNNEESIVTIPYIGKESLTHVYSDSEDNIDKESKRYDNLIQKFTEFYKAKPEFISRAPGRVNLIGEHIDYEGFAVLPMAIENDILIAVGREEIKDETADYQLNISHLHSEKFKEYSFEFKGLDKNIEFITPHIWVNYVIAGFNAIANHIMEKQDIITTSKQKYKINLLVTGNIPFASGLSSSSALTVSAAIAFTNVFGIADIITKQELALATINYERSVGTACGGMDQTISIYAEKDHAKLIEFNPELKAKTVILPDNVTFIIANSLTDSPKIDTLAYRYNKRVVENKLGLAIISYRQKLSDRCSILYDLKQTLKVDYSQLYNIINDSLKDGTYTLAEIDLELKGNGADEDYDVSEILKNIPHYDEVLNKNTVFNLKNRLLHVCLEAGRVEDFYNICMKEKDVDYKNIKKLGKLMNHSHMSCRELYECSSHELDKLVTYSLENKAIGARLTGAGWGGCCVIMVENENVSHLLSKLKEYYLNKADNDIKEEDLKEGNNQIFFCSSASQGACLFKLTN